MFVSELPSFFDVLCCEDLARKVCFYDVLEPSDLCVIEKTAARANVRIDETRVWRVLPPVRELVTVGVENRIKTKGLDRDLLFCWVLPRGEPMKHRQSWSSVKAR